MAVGFGRASAAAVDRRTVGAPLPSLPVWVGALTIDPGAPSDIRTIAKPLVVRLD